MVSLPFLTTHEQLALQLLNQFLYKIAVSRVQVTFEITDYYSFTKYEDLYSQKMNPSNAIKEVTENFCNILTLEKKKRV